MVAPLLIPSLIAAAPAVAGLFGKKKTSQVPLQTINQNAANEALLGFSRTGNFGDFKAGEEIPLGYGDYNATGIENQGLSSLQGLLSSGIPDQFRLGDDALRDLLDTSPGQIESQFNPFKAQTERQITDANTALKRNAGFTKNLYSTNTIQRLGDVQARGNETLTAELARLTNEALNRKERAIPLAYQSGQAQEGIAQGRIGSAMQYGGLTRQLNDASIKARDAELLRRRKELQLPIDAAVTVAGGNAQWGVPSVESSPFDDLLGLAGQIGGNYLGNELSMRQYQNYFGNNATPPPTSTYPTASSGYPYNFGNRLRLA